MCASSALCLKVLFVNPCVCVFCMQEARSASTRELEACHKELEEELSRQRLRFLEEAELSRVQSERCLQDRISQLKVSEKRGGEELVG